MRRRTLRRNTNPNAGLLRERGNCETSFETEAAATQIRHYGATSGLVASSVSGGLWHLVPDDGGAND